MAYRPLLCRNGDRPGPPGRTLVVGVTALAWMLVTACGEGPVRPEPGEPEATQAAVDRDPAARLGELLRRGAQPGELAVEERREVETLVLDALPETDGALAGHHWRVTYLDLPGADFVAIDLMAGEGRRAPRAAWFHLFYRSPRATPREPYSDRLGPYPARREPGEYLFVQAGDVELRAVPESEELREPGRLEALVQAFDLELLASL